MDYKSIKLLLIEDDPGDVDFIVEILSEVKTRSFDLLCADRLEKGLKFLADDPIDVVLLDLLLPDSQGLDTLTKIQAQAPGVPIVVLTGMSDEANAVKALQVGAQDYLVKGQVDCHLIVRSLQYAIERKRVEEKLRKSLEKLRRVMGGIIQAMTLTIETRDPYTAGHQRRVATLARAIACEMDLPNEQCDGIRIAGIVHDIGKISIAKEILAKPGKLNELDINMIRTHPIVGYNILKTIEFPWPIAQIVLQHQERLDGSGYPAGLEGENIILEARVLAVADVVEAMTFRRPYRIALGIDKALAEIIGNKGILYDPKVVDACMNLFHEKGFSFEQENHIK